MQRGQVSAAGGKEDARVTKRILGIIQPLYYHLVGFIPGDSLKLAFALRPYPFQWVLQTIGVMDILSISPASKAGPQLFIFIFNVISFNPENNVVLNIDSERAPPPAIKSGCSSDDLYPIINGTHILCTHVILPKNFLSLNAQTIGTM
jgi:hypothetical protein